MYYNVKLSWKEPIEGKEGLKKKTKRFLVNALSITEAELKVINWCPSNYQDPEVKGVDESKIVSLHKQNDSETWWNFIMSDENDKGKFVPFEIIINGNQEQEMLKEVSNKLYSTSQFESMKRFKIVVDDDLISNEVKK